MGREESGVEASRVSGGETGIVSGMRNGQSVGEAELLAYQDADTRIHLMGQLLFIGFK